MRSVVKLMFASLALSGSTSAAAACQSTFFCEHNPDQYNYICEASPQGVQYSYTWSRSGVASFPFGCTTEFCQVKCSSINMGNVTLTVFDNSVPEACGSITLNVCQ